MRVREVEILGTTNPSFNTLSTSLLMLLSTLTISYSILLSVAVEELPLSSLDFFVGDDLGFLTFLSRGGRVVRGVASSTLLREIFSGRLTDFDEDDV